MKLYVGNLSYDVTEADLKNEFQAYGTVTSVTILTDKFSGRPKGFGFVEMSSKPEGDAAIAALNGKTVKDRSMVVNEARPKTNDRGGGGYGDKRGGGGYGGGRSGGFGGGRSGGGRQRRY